MVIYSYALSNLLLPQVFWAPRLLAYLFVALATVLLGYIARLEFGKGFAWPVMWLVTPMVLLPGMDQFPANTEMFLLLPLLATFAVYVHARHSGQKTKILACGGISRSHHAVLQIHGTAAGLRLSSSSGRWSSWRQTRDVRTLLKFFLAGHSLRGAGRRVWNWDFFWFTTAARGFGNARCFLTVTISTPAHFAITGCGAASFGTTGGCCS